MQATTVLPLIDPIVKLLQSKDMLNIKNLALFLIGMLFTSFSLFAQCTHCSNPANPAEYGGTFTQTMYKNATLQLWAKTTTTLDGREWFKVKKAGDTTLVGYGDTLSVTVDTTCKYIVHNFNTCSCGGTYYSSYVTMASVTVVDSGTVPQFWFAYAPTVCSKSQTNIFLNTNSSLSGLTYQYLIDTTNVRGSVTGSATGGPLGVTLTNKTTSPQVVRFVVRMWRNVGNAPYFDSKSFYLTVKPDSPSTADHCVFPSKPIQWPSATTDASTYDKGSHVQFLVDTSVIASGVQWYKVLGTDTTYVGLGYSISVTTDTACKYLARSYNTCSCDSSTYTSAYTLVANFSVTAAYITKVRTLQYMPTIASGTGLDIVVQTDSTLPVTMYFFRDNALVTGSTSQSQQANNGSFSQAFDLILTNTTTSPQLVRYCIRSQKASLGANGDTYTGYLTVLPSTSGAPTGNHCVTPAKVTFGASPLLSYFKNSTINLDLNTGSIVNGAIGHNPNPADSIEWYRVRGPGDTVFVGSATPVNTTVDTSFSVIAISRNTCYWSDSSMHIYKSMPTLLAKVTATSGTAVAPTITNSKTNVCNGTAANITSTLSGFSNYLWYRSNTTNVTGTASGSLSSSTTPMSITPTLTDTVTTPQKVYFVAFSGAGSYNSQTITSVVVYPDCSKWAGLVTAVHSLKDSICSGDTATLTADTLPGYGNSHYAWSSGDTTRTIHPTSAGTYTVTVTNACGCSATASKAIVVKSLPTVAVTSDTICAGDTATLTASGGVNYAWSTSAITNSITTTTAGTYHVTVTNSLGCSLSASAIVTVNALPTPTVNNPTVCAGHTATLTATGGVTYLWSTGATTSNITTDTSATFVVTVSNTAGCSATAQGVATINTTVIAKAGKDTTLTKGSALILGDTVSYGGGQDPYTFKWEPNIFLLDTTVPNPYLMPDSSVAYYFTVKDSLGCSAKDTIYVTVPQIKDSALIVSFSDSVTGIVDSVISGGGITVALTFKNIGTATYNDTITISGGFSFDTLVTINALRIYTEGKNDPDTIVYNPVLPFIVHISDSAGGIIRIEEDIYASMDSSNIDSLGCFQNFKVKWISRGQSDSIIVPVKVQRKRGATGVLPMDPNVCPFNYPLTTFTGVYGNNLSQDANIVSTYDDCNGVPYLYACRGDQLLIRYWHQCNFALAAYNPLWTYSWQLYYWTGGTWQIQGGPQPGLDLHVNTFGLNGNGGTFDAVLTISDASGAVLFRYYSKFYMYPDQSIPIVPNQHSASHSGVTACGPTSYSVCLDETGLPEFADPCSGSGALPEYFKLNVDWGDGSSLSFSTGYLQDMCHTYTTPGLYTITMSDYISYDEFGVQKSNSCIHRSTSYSIWAGPPNIQLDQSRLGYCSGQADYVTLNVKPTYQGPNAPTSWFNQYTYKWSPATDLYTNITGTPTAYTAGTASSTVYAKPSVTTTYTVTATDINGCSSTSTATITVDNTCCTAATINIDHPISISSFISQHPSYFTPYGNNGGYKTTSSFGSSTITISGNVDIDVPLYIVNANQITLSPDASLTVKTGSTLFMDGVTLKGCSAMWAGINVKEGGSILVQNSRIYDAKIGVETYLTPKVLQLFNTDFYRDNYGYVSFLDPQDNSNNPNWSIVACRFIFDPSSLIANYMLPPYSTSANPSLRPESGITLLGNNAVTIGNYGAYSFSNQFVGLNNGIVGTWSYMNVYSNIFKDIRNYNHSTFLGAGAAVFSDGTPYLNNNFGNTGAQVVTLSSKALVGSPVTFQNCQIGIGGSYANITAYYNRISGSSTSYSFTDQTTYTGILCLNPSREPLYATANYIDNIDFGIHISKATGGASLIHGNTINANKPYGKPGLFQPRAKTTCGVWQDEISNTSKSRLGIGFPTSGNIISGGQYAIQLQNVNNTKVLANTLNSTDNFTVDVRSKQARIYVQNSKNVQVSEQNLLTGNSYVYDDAPPFGPSSHRKMGTWFDNSTHCEICNNTFSLLGYESYFTADNSLTKLRNNTYGSAKYAIVLAKNGVQGQIGQQGNATDAKHGNSFVDAAYYFNSGQYMTMTLGSDGSRSPFYYDPRHAAPDYFTPFPNGTDGPNGTEITIHAGIATPPTCCATNIDLCNAYFKRDDAYRMAVASGDIYDYADTPSHSSALWMAQRRLYREMKDNPTDSTLVDTVYSNFYKVAVEKGISNLANIEDKIGLMGQGLADSVRMDSTTYFGILSDAVSELSFVPDSPVYSLNLKNLNTIYLNTIARGLSVSDSGDLALINTLAHSCPYDQGDAVYMARSLNSLYAGGEVIFDDDVICEIDSVTRRTASAHPAVVALDSALASMASARLIPNPAANQTSISYHTGKESYNKAEIYDNLGRLVWSGHSIGNSGVMNIDLSSMAEGVYLVRFVADDKVILNTKLVVRK